MATYIKNDTSYVDAILFDGENVADVIDFMTDGETGAVPDFTVMESTVQGRPITVLVCIYENKKGEECEVYIPKNNYCKASKSGYNVIGKDSFESKYELV